MKTILKFIALLLLGVNSYATVRTVSNDPNGGAQYNTIQAAYNAASNGDTIYAEGTNIPYIVTNTSTPWAKNLVLMGIGVSPSKTNARRTIIGGGGLFYINNSAAGSRFHGIVFQANPSMIGPIVNIHYENCEFAGNYDFSNINFSNFSFTNCWFNGPVGLGVGSFNNLLFTSCIFNSFLNSTYNTSIAQSIIIDHCLFLYSGTISGGLSNAMISNNIFMNTTALGTLINSTVMNNIARLNNVFNVGVGNSLIANQSNTNPLLVNCPVNTNFAIGTSRDYHLSPGSPALGNGSAGSDIGPHGSLSHFNENGEVLFAPIMRSLIINNTTVVPNGTLNVQIYSTKPSNN